MGLVGDILVQGLEALAVRLHVESCKECRKKYEEIVKHALKEFEEHASSHRDKG